MHQPFKIILRVILIIAGIVIVAYIAMAVYIAVNKEKLLATITTELNERISGTLAAESMEPSLLTGFPGISMSLNKVTLRDSLWTQHRHTLLEAGKLDVSVDILAFIFGTVKISRIGIRDTEIYLYTDSTGYSNTSAFKTDRQQQNDPEKKDKQRSPAEIGRFDLRNASFTLDNRKSDKLFGFAIKRLKGNIDYHSGGWKAEADADIFIKSLAFNTAKGSFLKDKIFKGQLAVVYSSKTGELRLAPSELDIGSDRFIIGAVFNTANDPVTFKIDVGAKQILWKNAASLLAQNIAVKLRQFDLKKPFEVKAVIAGNLGPGSQPSVDVSGTIRNNDFRSPGGNLSDCSFDAFFTNHRQSGKGFNDENSMIRVLRFSGKYDGEIPVRMDTMVITDLKRPEASGIVRSEFPVKKLNAVNGNELFEFNSGTAAVNLKYKAMLVDFQLYKPSLTGSIDIKNAAATYLPRNIHFKNSSFGLLFTEDHFYLRNVRLQSGQSIVNMEGNVLNFKNLFYNAPEKIVFNLQVRSPQLYLGEFLGFLEARKAVVRTTPRKTVNRHLTEQINAVLEKSQAYVILHADKLYYNRFTATDVNAALRMDDKGISFRNVSLNHAGGRAVMTGDLSQKGNYNQFSLQTTISDVNIQRFFYSFKNFGMESLTDENLRGYLSARANLSGRIGNTGQLLQRSMEGTASFSLKKGALVGFEPVKNVGKFAFPFRDMSNITFSTLNGKFDINDGKVSISPMMISSSVLNMNVVGVYSFTKGTRIELEVPLRNPKKDESIADGKERLERRMRGIVLHLLASDGDDGKIKIGWNKNRKKEEDADEEEAK